MNVDFPPVAYKVARAKTTPHFRLTVGDRSFWNVRGEFVGIDCSCGAVRCNIEKRSNNGRVCEEGLSDATSAVVRIVEVPDFKNAEVTTVAEDLTQYNAFLAQYHQGQVVRLPLVEGETPRRVMRALNKAAAANGVRLIRLRSDEDHVRFRITSQQRRVVNLSEEARRARVEKARATRARNRAAAHA